MITIIPMSGSGSRFSNDGYLLPKPLIPVSGKTMIERVIESMPKTDKWMFVVRKEHVEDYNIDEHLKSIVPGAEIIIDTNPHGQASSCMLAVEKVDPEEDIFVAACDNSFMYSREKFEALKRDTDVDSIIWTFTQNALLKAKPEAWGWMKLQDDGLTIDDVSVKVPVSNDPYNDHAVVATFYFKKAGEFVQAYNEMVEMDYKINNEWYIDAFPKFYTMLGKRSVIFDVDLYVGWGKPADLYEYQLKEYKYNASLLDESDVQDRLWKSFFTSLNE